MDWLKNRTVQRFVLVGFLGGLLVTLLGFWLEFNRNHLPLAWWAFPYIHRTQPLMFMLDFAPIVFAAMAGMLGLQYSLSGTIARGKKEWEATFDSIADLIFVVDGQGKIIRCNHAVIDRLNKTYMQVIGKSITDILSLPGENGADGLADDTKGFSWLGHIYEVSMVPIQTEGSLSQSLFILRDITRRKQAEEQLAASAREMRALFGAMQDVVMVFDREGRYVQIVPTSTSQLYQSPQEMLGKTVFDVLPQSPAQIIYNAIQQVLQTGKLVHVEYALPVRDNQEEVWKDAAVSPLTENTVFWIARDITERKKVEAELLREKQFLEALILNSPAAIVEYAGKDCFL